MEAPPIPEFNLTPETEACSEEKKSCLNDYEPQNVKSEKEYEIKLDDSNTFYLKVAIDDKCIYFKSRRIEEKASFYMNKYDFDSIIDFFGFSKKTYSNLGKIFDLFEKAEKNKKLSFLFNKEQKLILLIQIPMGYDLLDFQIPLSKVELSQKDKIDYIFNQINSGQNAISGEISNTINDLKEEIKKLKKLNDIKCCFYFKNKVFLYELDIINSNKKFEIKLETIITNFGEENLPKDCYISIIKDDRNIKYEPDQIFVDLSSIKPKQAKKFDFNFYFEINKNINYDSIQFFIGCKELKRIISVSTKKICLKKRTEEDYKENNNSITFSDKSQITLIFSVKDKNQITIKEIPIRCFSNEIVQNVIMRYRTESDDTSELKKFIFNAKRLNETLTVQENELVNNSKIFVIDSKKSKKI